jgi:hypothetical protein
LWAIATANGVILRSCIQRSSEVAARQGLASSRRCARTKDGLYHNEYKSKIMASNNVISETALDRLFDQIREEVEDDETYVRVPTVLKASGRTRKRMKKRKRTT